MPRRRWFGAAFGAPRRASQRSVKIVPMKVPDVRVLSAALKGYVSPSETDRLAALAAACLWYDDALLWVMSDTNHLPGLPQTEFAKAIDIAAKCRARAGGSTFPAEKDTALRTAIERYEKVCCKVPKLPLLAASIAEFEKERVRDEARQAALDGKFQALLGEIQTALGLPFKVGFCEHDKFWVANGMADGCTGHQITWQSGSIRELKVEDDKARARKACPDVGMSVYNVAAAKALADDVKRQGLLPVMLRELNVLTRHSAYETPDGGNTWVLNRDKLNALREQALVNLTAWLATATPSTKLVRAFVPNAVAQPLGAPAINVPHVPRVQGPRAPRVPGVVSFQPGSVRDRLYSLLQAAPGHSVALADVLRCIGRNHKTEIGRVSERGLSAGLFRIDNIGGMVTLVHLTATQPQTQTQNGGGADA